MLICIPWATVLLEFLISIIKKKLNHITWIDLNLQRKTVPSSSLREIIYIYQEEGEVIKYDASRKEKILEIEVTLGHECTIVVGSKALLFK